MKNKVISFLLAVLIVALFLFLMLPSAHQKSLDSKEKVYKKSLDSLKIVNEKLEASIKKLERKAIFWQIRYDDLESQCKRR